MKNTNIILNNPLFVSSIKVIENDEENREFCCHSIDHLLDTARIAYIMCLESGLGYSKDLIYSVALLHDIGRCDEYENNKPHNVASAEKARIILESCDFDADTKETIIDAIVSHREKNKCMQSLSSVLYNADKQSRLCFKCKAKNECKWTAEEKNEEIKY